jgi:hypothetical protein
MLVFIIVYIVVEEEKKILKIVTVNLINTIAMLLLLFC